MGVDDDEDMPRMLEAEPDQTALAVQSSDGGDAGGGGGEGGYGGGDGGDSSGGDTGGADTGGDTVDTGGVDPVDTGEVETTVDTVDTESSDTGETATTDTADTADTGATDTADTADTDTDATDDTDVAETTDTGSADADAEETAAEAGLHRNLIPVVDGATGRVVAYARYNPDTATFEFDDPEVTVVEESSSAPVTITVGRSEDVSFEENPGSGASPTGTPKGNIPPRVFRFRKVLDNWQETDCVPLVFSSPLSSYPEKVTVGIRVGAPLKLGTGKTIGPDEAAEDSSFAAEAAALAIVRLLDIGAPPGAIQKAFYQFMQQVLDNFHKGFRVNDCTGSL